MNTFKIVSALIGIAVVVSALLYARGEHQAVVAAHAELRAQAAQYQAAAATAKADAEHQSATLQAKASELADQLVQAQAARDAKQQAVTGIIRAASGPCLNEPVPPGILSALRNGGGP